MQPLTATAAKPPEDIDAVLGRFQAWSATRKATDKTTQKTAPKQSDDLPDGVRELSYEEALESSRYRWQARTQPSVICDSTQEIAISAHGQSVSAVTQEEPAPEAVLAQAAFNTEAIQPDKLSLTSAGPPVRTTAPPDKSVAPAFGSRPRRSPTRRTRPPTRILARLPSYGLPRRKASARCR